MNIRSALPAQSSLLRSPGHAVWLRRISAAVGLVVVLAAAARAQTYPVRPITLIVPGPAGGTPDIVARELAERLRAELGQTVIVDNRAGGNGFIGVSAVGRAEPDGYTLLMGFAQTMAINPVTFRKLPYDATKDFVPVARLVEFELALAVPGSLPVRSVSELSSWLKAHPERASYGSFGGGTPSQFAGAMFARKIDLNMVHVPYKGSAPLVNDLIGAQVQMGFVVPQIAQPHLAGGKLKVLAMTGDTRAAAMPGIPTMKELGYDDVVAAGWYGLFAPKGTPPAIVARLDKAVAASMRDPALVRSFVNQGLKPAPLDSSEFAAFQQSEIARWRAVAIRTNFKPED